MFDAATATANAAEEMQERLAYAEASELFQAAIHLVNDSDVRTTSESLLSRCKLGLAQSWENLGKCMQAGQLYSELASATTNADDKLNLEQKASFLRMIDDQIRLPLREIESLASSAGVRLFRWPTLYLVMTGLYRVIRGLVNPRRQNDPQTAHRLQILTLLTRGLLLTNPLMAAYFAARLTVVSKRRGDAEVYENALDLEGLLCRSVRLPWRIDRLGTREVNRHIAARHHNRDPLKRGFLHLSNAIAAFANGRMLESLDENDQALRFYRQTNNSPTWEAEILAAFRLWAMHWHGDFN
ncbi:MAG: hypothetical protein ABI614_10665 [Planctomycetota bacterium]